MGKTKSSGPDDVYRSSRTEQVEHKAIYGKIYDIKIWVKQRAQGRMMFIDHLEQVEHKAIYGKIYDIKIWVKQRAQGRMMFIDHLEKVEHKAIYGKIYDMKVFQSPSFIGFYHFIFSIRVLIRGK